MSNINITFTEIWVLWFIIPALILTVIPLFFIKKKRRRSLKYISSTIMRCIALILVLTMLSGFTVTSQSDLTSVVIVVDLSDSTQTVRSEMREYVNGFVEKLDKKTQVAMVGFGFNTVVEVPMDFLENADPEKEFYHIKRVPFPSATATNIADAMQFASELLVEDTNKRIVLLSDGLETDGYADVKARELANKGVRVDVVDLDSYDPSLNEVQISDVKVLENAYTGDPLTFEAVIESNVDASVTLNLYDGEDIVAETKAEIVSGENKVNIETTAGIAGVHSFKIEAVVEADTVAVNNSMYCFVKIAGTPNVLIVDGVSEKKDIEEGDYKEAHEVVKLLEAVDYTCTVVAPKDFPKNMSQLRNYDEIVLMNVDMDDMPKDSAELIKEYVSRLGRGLFTTGGDNTYIYGSMEKTVMEEMLPINMRLDQDELPSTAMVILIDNSSSMSGQRFTMAKKGAIKSINSLADKDFVSVITFAENAEKVFGLTSMYEHTSIIESVADIKLSHGTKLRHALELAHEELKNFEGVDQKQVLILSDGEPSDSGHQAIVREMKKDGISTSTVVVSGTFGSNERLMNELANLGGGKCYVVRDVDDLPNIMLDATLAGKGDYVNNVTFTPETKSFSQALLGVTPVPQLDGYISASVKDHATTVLEFTDTKTGNSRPIYAEWQYGLGRVASFTSDLSGRWSSKWLSTEAGVTFVRNVTSAILPADNEKSSLITDINLFSRSAEISVKTEDLYGEKVLEGTLYSPGKFSTEIPLELTMTSPGVYTANTKIDKEGVYTLMMWQFDPKAEDPTIPVDSTEQAFCVSYSSEYDVFAEKTDLLSQVAMLSGGISAKNPDELANVPAVPMEDVLDTFTPMAIAAAILMLLDILVRKLKLKDLKHLFVTFGRGVKKLFTRSPKEA